MASIVDWTRRLADYDCEPNPGLNPDYVPLVDRLIGEALSAEEKTEIESRGLSDPNQWVMPDKPLPSSYLSFLALSNGGWFAKGDRELSMLGGEELREYLLTYELPANMPGAIPFAADGNGGLYLFDTRAVSDTNGEYPILHVLADRFNYDDAETVASTFPDWF